MSDDTAGQQTTAGQDQTGDQPTMIVNAQYVKDLSFENPNAPASLMQQDKPPEIQVGVDTSVVKLEGSTYEVTLTIRAEGKSGDKNLFIAETAYAGIVTLGEVPDEYVAPLLYVEAPRQFFPFARAVIAECVRDGGFPPLLIHPIDFMALFQQRAQELAASQQTAADGSGEDAASNKGDQKFQFEL